MQSYSKGRQLLTAAVISCCIATVHAEQPAFDNLSKMVADGKAALDIRYRFEYVDQDGISKEAEASAVRSRVALASAEVAGISFLLEMDHITSVGPNDYNSTANGKTEFPVVADPEASDLNQAWLKYRVQQADGTLGRQRINHGSERFVGGVGWRQNEQTYDGFRATYSPTPSVKLDYTYVYNINRIFGPDDTLAQPADLEGNNHFLKADFTIAEGHTIGGFGYLLDIDDEKRYPAGRSVDNSTNTYGVDYRGKIGVVSVAATYASQSETGDSNLDYDADYYLLEVGANFQSMSISAGYEVLASDNGGFQNHERRRKQDFSRKNHRGM